MAPSGKLLLANTMVMFMITITINMVFGNDPDPLQDFCPADLESPIKVNGYPCKKDYTAEDFMTTALAYPGDYSDSIWGSKLSLASVEEWPGVNTQGVSANRVDFGPGGLNPPHLHPRASEIQHVMKGKVLFGIITANSRYYSKVAKQGETIVFPRGLVHFQKNVGKEPAIVLVFFNSQNPGVIIIPNVTFNSTPPVPDNILAQGFGIDKKVVKYIKSQLSSDTIDDDDDNCNKNSNVNLPVDEL